MKSCNFVNKNRNNVKKNCEILQKEFFKSSKTKLNLLSLSFPHFQMKNSPLQTQTRFFASFRKYQLEKPQKNVNFISFSTKNDLFFNKRTYTTETTKEEENTTFTTIEEMKTRIIFLLSQIKQQQFFGNTDEGIFTSKEFSTDLFAKRAQNQRELTQLVRNSIVALHENSFLTEILFPIVYHFEKDFSLIPKIISTAQVNSSCLLNFINEIYFHHKLPLKIVCETISLSSNDWNFREFSNLLEEFMKNYFVHFPKPIPIIFTAPSDDPSFDRNFDNHLFQIEKFSDNNNENNINDNK